MKNPVANSLLSTKCEESEHFEPIESQKITPAKRTKLFLSPAQTSDTFETGTRVNNINFNFRDQRMKKMVSLTSQSAFKEHSRSQIGCQKDQNRVRSLSNNCRRGSFTKKEKLLNEKFWDLVDIESKQLTKVENLARFQNHWDELRARSREKSKPRYPKKVLKTRNFGEDYKKIWKKSENKNRHFSENQLEKFLKINKKCLKRQKLELILDRNILDYSEPISKLTTKFKNFTKIFVQLEKFGKKSTFKTLQKAILQTFQCDFKKRDLEFIQSCLKKSGLSFGTHWNLQSSIGQPEDLNDFTITVNRDILTNWNDIIDQTKSHNEKACFQNHRKVYSIGVSTDQCLNQFQFFKGDYLVLLEKLKSAEAVRVFQEIVEKEIALQMQLKREHQQNRVNQKKGQGCNIDRKG